MVKPWSDEGLYHYVGDVISMSCFVFVLWRGYSLLEQVEVTAHA